MLLRPYEGAENKRLVIAGDEVFVDLGNLTRLALIFHELATNSTKYGALNNPDGVLRVHVSRDTDDLRVRWTETAPIKTAYFDIADGGFGSKLLDLTINEQLQGRYARTYTQAGPDIEIILPAKLFSNNGHEFSKAVTTVMAMPASNIRLDSMIALKLIEAPSNIRDLEQRLRAPPCRHARPDSQ